MTTADAASEEFDLSIRSGPHDVAMEREASFVSVAVVATALAFSTKLIEYVINLGGTGTPPLAQVAYFLSYGLFIVLLARANGLTRLPFVSPVLAAVILMAPLSLLWTINLSETAERSIAIVGSSLFGVYLGWRFTLGRMIYLLAVALTVAAILSLVAIFLVPSVGIDQTGAWSGYWRGVHFHKNGLGAASSLGALIIGYALADSRGGTRLFLGFGFVLSLVLMVGSGSTTALLSAVCMGAIALWARRLQKLPTEVPVLTIIVIFAVLALALEFFGIEAFESTLEFFGKNPNVSGRLPLWTILWNGYIESHFWLGYGYEAFWTPESKQVLEISRKLYYTPHYAHNGIMESWINGGVVLVFLALLMLILTTFKSTLLVSRWRVLAISSFPLVYCGYFILTNVTESTVMYRNSLNWVIFVALTVFVSKWIKLRVR